MLCSEFGWLVFCGGLCVFPVVLVYGELCSWVASVGVVGGISYWFVGCLVLLVFNLVVFSVWLG